MPQIDPINILVLNDSQSKLLESREYLDFANANIFEVRSIEEALDRIQDSNFALIILGYPFSFLKTLEVAKQIRNSNRNRKTHIIFILNNLEPENIREATALGKVDFLFEPVQPELVSAKIAVYLELFSKSKEVEDLQAFVSGMSPGETSIRYRSILDSALDAIITCEEQGLVTVWNRKAESVFGWSAAEAVGQSLTSLIIPPRFRDAHEKGMKRFLKSGEAPILNRRIEISGLKKNGEEIPVELTVSQAQINGIWIFTAFLRDLTEQLIIRTRLQLQYTVSEVLSRAENTQQAVRGILNAICKQDPWDCGILWMIDEAKGEAFFEDFKTRDGNSCDTFVEISRELRFKQGQGFPGRAWQLNEPLLIDDLSLEKNFLRSDAAIEANLKSGMFLPIFSEGKVTAVLEFFSSRSLGSLPEFMTTVLSISNQLVQFIERRLAEENLRRSRDELDAIVKGVTNAITAQGPTGQLFYANDAAANYLGYSSSKALLDAPINEVISRFEILDEKGNPFPIDLFPGRRALQGFTDAGTTLRYREIATGVEKWSIVNATPIYGQDRTIKSVINFFQDITEQKNIELDLRNAKEQLAIILEGIADGIIVQKPDGKLVYINEAMARLLNFPTVQSVMETEGTPEAELLRNQIQLLDEEGNTFPSEKSPGRIALSGQIVEPVQLRWRMNSNSRELWVICHARPIFDGEGKVLFAVTMVKDITAMKEAELASKASERQLQMVFNNITEIVSLIEVEKSGSFRLIKTNDAYSILTGLPKETVIGKKINEIMSECKYISWLATANQVLSLNKTIKFESQGIDDSTTLIFNQSWTPIFDETGTCNNILIVATNITELKNTEEQLRQSLKMEAVGRLAGGIAHDFNNLLTVINGYSQLVLKGLPNEHPYREPILEIKNAGERAASLTQQLLAFGRQQFLKARNVNLNELVENMHKMLDRIIGEDIQLKLSLDSDLGVIRADPGQIEQIILNLALNARDAMPQGGSLSLETQNVELEANQLKNYLEAPPGMYAMLAVGDTGMGMNEEVKKRIFEPFFTTKPVGKGTGLGLSTVYGIVKQSGGDIYVYSEPSMGTTFKIYLPIIGVESGSKSSSSSGLLQLEAPKGSETILLVEDEEMVRKFVRESLEMLGYTVIEAEDGVAALQIINETSTSIDLLLTDVIMPNLNGPALAAKLNTSHPKVKILFMSGYSDNVTIQDIPPKLKANWLSKPLSPILLARKIREVLEV